MAENWENLLFFFQDHSIWIVTIKLSLLRTGYFSSAGNVLTSRSSFFHVNKRDIFQLYCLFCDQSIWQRCCNVQFNSRWASLPCCLSKGPLKLDFLDIYLTKFSESIISEGRNWWQSYFSPKHFKLNLGFEYPAKKIRKSLFLR